MLSLVARRTAASVARPSLNVVGTASWRAMSEAAAPVTDKVKLNFCLPHEAIYSNTSVESVIIPGLAGEYGITAGHSPIVAELKAGVVQIIHETGKDPEKFFVSAGFALTHSNSVTDITAIEAVRLDEIDDAAVKTAYSTAQAAFNAAPEGGKEKAEAQVAMECATAMAAAVGTSV